MKLQLKNIYLNERFSEETNCFKADLFVNGKKIAYCENDGHGGCTNYQAYKVELLETLKSVEDFCLTLPPMVYDWNGKQMVIKMNLEHWIDKEIEATLIKKQEKKIDKDCAKAICYGNDYAYYKTEFSLGGKKLSIDDMMKTEAGRKKIDETCMEKIKQGHKILNKNIPTAFKIMPL